MIRRLIIISIIFSLSACGASEKIELTQTKNEQVSATKETCIKATEEKTVEGDLMNPMLSTGSKINLLVSYYECNEVERGDLISYDYKGGKSPMIKIVYALGGDKLEFQNNNLLINGEVMKNSADEIYFFQENEINMISLYIQDGKLIDSAFLIFGDNTKDSIDSRKFGAVSKQDFFGKFEKI